MSAKIQCLRLPEQLPAAWLGYAKATDKGAIFAVRVCSWCPDKTKADELAAASGFKVTHSLCTSCYQKQLEQLKL